MNCHKWYFEDGFYICEQCGKEIIAEDYDKFCDGVCENDSQNT